MRCNTFRTLVWTLPCVPSRTCTRSCLHISSRSNVFLRVLASESPCNGSTSTRDMLFSMSCNLQITFHVPIETRDQRSNPASLKPVSFTDFLPNVFPLYVSCVHVAQKIVRDAQRCTERSELELLKTCTNILSFPRCCVADRCTRESELARGDCLAHQIVHGLMLTYLVWNNVLLPALVLFAMSMARMGAEFCSVPFLLGSEALLIHQ